MKNVSLDFFFFYNDVSNITLIQLTDKIALLCTDRL